MVAIANVALTDTFDTWRLRTNQIITYLDQANSGAIIAAAAGKTANASFYHANSAYDKANITSNVATAAFNHANSAFDKANTGGTFSGNVTFSGHTIAFTSNMASQILTDSASISWNLSNGTVATITLGGNRTLANATNKRVGSYILHVYQDGTGNRSLSFESEYKWPAGVAPTVSTTANSHDVFSFVCDGTFLYGSFLPDVK